MSLEVTKTRRGAVSCPRLPDILESDLKLAFLTPSSVVGWGRVARFSKKEKTKQDTQLNLNFR